MTIGNTRAALEARKVLREGDIEISERAYNLIIGGVLLWGFLLNWLIVKCWGDSVVAYVSRNGSAGILIGYIVCALVGGLMISRPNAVTSFIGYNLIALPVGILLCVALNGLPSDMIATAAMYTGIITLLFMILGSTYPGFFLSIGRVLLTDLGILLLGSFILMLVGGSDLALCWAGAGLFGMYVGFDWARCSVCACTVDNAVDAAANLYLDIINIFLRVLSIMNRGRSRD